MKFEYINVYPQQIFATTISENSGQVYAILLTNEVEICTCMGHWVRGYCKHVDALRFLYYKKNIDINLILDENIMANMIETKLKAFNSLMGGLPIGMNLGIYGAPEKNKTTLATQFSFDVMSYWIKKLKQAQIKKQKGRIAAYSDKQNALYIDTEGGYYDFVLMGEDDEGKSWIEKFNKRYGTNVGAIHYRVNMEKWIEKKSAEIPLRFLGEWNEDAPNKIIVIDVGRLQELLLMLGRPLTFSYGKPKTSRKKAKREHLLFDSEGTGKVETFHNPAWKKFEYIFQTPIAKWISEYEIGYVVLDSLSHVIASEFPNAAQAFPARATAIGIILDQINNVSQHYGIPSVVLHHMTGGNTMFGKGQATGGKMVGHQTKFWLYMKGTSDERQLQRERHPNRSEGEIVVVKMTNEGLIDL